MRAVLNKTDGKLTVEWLNESNKWQTIANLLPGERYESHPTFAGAIRVGVYDDRYFKERPDVEVVVIELRKGEKQIHSENEK
jgi:hypothetical protein